MIEFIEGLPEKVIAVRLSGVVKEEDYDNVLAPAIENEVQKYGRFAYFTSWIRISRNLPAMRCSRI
ncbi:MAG: hypothetical protein SCH66_10870 [Methanolobus sp.]|nr:hypothetical protein [Methanolobus sp.]